MGWKIYCPSCKEEKDTTCCACGCGNCLTCNYRFICNQYPETLQNLPKVSISLKKYYFISYNVQLESGTERYAFFQTVTSLHPFEWCSNKNKHRVNTEWYSIISFQEVSPEEYGIYSKLDGSL